MKNKKELKRFNINDILGIDDNDIFLETDYSDEYNIQMIGLNNESRFIQVLDNDEHRKKLREIIYLQNYYGADHVQFYFITTDISFNDIEINCSFKGYIVLENYFEAVFEID